MAMKKTARKSAVKAARKVKAKVKEQIKKPAALEKTQAKPPAGRRTSAQPAEAPPRKKPEVAGRQAVEGGGTGAAEQKVAFEKAMQQFHQRNFKEAKQYFQTAFDGPNRGMAHTARQHFRMCEQRMAAQQPQLQTPEEHYTYAVALLNLRRDLALAEQHLRTAIQGQPGGDHLHYALALCLGLKGDVAGASEAMARAIELRPANRGAARVDPDFREIGQYSPLRDLLLAEVV